MSNMIKGLLGTWGTLGFYRGVQQYNFENKQKIQTYKNDKIRYPEIDFFPPTYFYTSTLVYGTSGFFFYLFPGTVPICFVKELYRVEINMRGIEAEKQTFFYNNMLL